MTALADRVKRARALVDAGMVAIVRRKRVNGKKRQRGWSMPSASELGSWHEVYALLERHGDAVRGSFVCNRRYRNDTAPDGNGMQKCEGNTRTVCYHCLAAMVKLAKGRRMTVQFVDSRAKAQALSRMGTVVEMHGEGQAEPKVWAVMKKRRKARR
jgi:hypothetical protein